MMTWKLVGVAVMALAVTACGTEPRERTTGGAAAGAATGAGIGALGGPVGALAGAAIGAGAGAATGAATSPRDVNLGEPPWSNPEVRTPLDNDRSSRAGTRSARRDHAGSSSVQQAQRELNQRGFNAGSADGVWGPQTSQAAMAFQRANNLDPTGRLDSRTMQALNMDASRSSTAQRRDDRNRAYMGGGTTGTDNRATGSTTTTGPTGSGGPGMNDTRSTTGTGTMGTGTSTGNPGVGGGGIGSSTTTGPGSMGGVGSGTQPGTGGTTPR
ncbi:peptidoglycan-binding domain-containing protein [Siccirubricoccus sp. G192]|uniref:peptidoglycan-binding domain-containing protein n=1 Tax=Siccirubricoccus sp. G192 TaxID=2849651 RepID=UPI001C2C1489|nr:peptidoglycan-binding domain-containing protein [Siccirubricoccus sp. G192]MBV1800251.1 peptidoglycan-binding protein [Siccirubricoccus sp. G192]